MFFKIFGLFTTLLALLAFSTSGLFLTVQPVLAVETPVIGRSEILDIRGLQPIHQQGSPFYKLSYCGWPWPFTGWYSYDHYVKVFNHREQDSTFDLCVDLRNPDSVIFETATNARYEVGRCNDCPELDSETGHILIDPEILKILSTDSEYPVSACDYKCTNIDGRLDFTERLKNHSHVLFFSDQETIESEKIFGAYSIQLVNYVMADNADVSRFSPEPHVVVSLGPGSKLIRKTSNGDRFLSYSICNTYDCTPVKYKFFPQSKDVKGQVSVDPQCVNIHIFVKDCARDPHTGYCLYGSFPTSRFLVTYAY